MVTFDEWGVSGHPNHKSTYFGVRYDYSGAESPYLHHCKPSGCIGVFLEG